MTSNMASQQGGYQQPSNPAPVSGPGALSQRTDGGATEGMTQPQQQYSGMPYGQNKNVNDQQGSAPLAGNPINVIPLSSPTLKPNEPISHGADWGPGPGLDTTVGINRVETNPTNTIYRMMQFDTSGQLESIYNRLNQGQ